MIGHSLVMKTAFFGCILMAGAPAHAQTETVLFNFETFQNPAGASVPTSAPLVNASGNLYGATRVGGAEEEGTIYEVTYTEARQWKPQVYGWADILAIGTLCWRSRTERLAGSKHFS